MGNTWNCMIFIVAMVGCASPESSNPYDVEHAGALKNMMHKGDISAKADLDSLKTIPNLYALGARENLKGEVLIMNSRPYISYVEGETMLVDSTYDHRASLLVYASVSDWNSHEIPSDIVSHDDLETFIERTAKESGMDVNAPFPFMLEGRPKAFDWHVIDWPEGDTDHSHEKHVNSGPHGTITVQEVEILGFYSDSHHAIFTHHTTNMHMHFRLVNGSIAGHVDDITLGQGMILKLPEH